MQDQKNNLIYQKDKTGNLIRTFTRGNFLGKGGFAQVYQITDNQNGHTYAAKIVKKSSLSVARTRQKLESQIRIHYTLDHKHIVKFERFFSDSENYYLLLELCQNQTLNELIRRRKNLSQIEVQCYLLQILKAIKYLKQNKIIHRDLKLGNLFITKKMNIKLGDFGLATKLDYIGQRRKTICGTPNYIAPQILQKEHGHSFEVDVWSIGVIAYVLTIGKPPFETTDIQSTYRKIKACNYSFPQNANLSKQFISMIRNIFVLDPSKRITVEDLMDHDFFKKNKIPQILPNSSLLHELSNVYLNEYQKEERISEEIKEKKQRLLELRCQRRKLILNDVQNKKSGYQTQRGTTNLTSNYHSIRNQIKRNIQLDQKIILMSYRNSVDIINKTSSANSLRKYSSNAQFRKTPNQHTKQWVKMLCWIDFTAKFGIAYVLNNGIYAAVFNDQTKIITNKNFDQILYIEKGIGIDQLFHQINEKSVPENMKKKYRLMNHFKSQLDQKLGSQIENILLKNKSNLMQVYIYRWTKLQHAMIFHYNIELKQVAFNDGTQLYIDIKRNCIRYINKYKQILFNTIQEALYTSNKELHKRVHYANDALKNILSKIGKKAKIQISKLTTDRRSSEKKSSERKKSIDKKKEIKRSANSVRNLFSIKENLKQGISIDKLRPLQALQMNKTRFNNIEYRGTKLSVYQSNPRRV